MKNGNKYYERILDGCEFTYVDLGSRGGLSTEWKKVSDIIRVILFEPEATEAEALKDTGSGNTTVIPSAVWNTKGEISFHSTRNPSYSSVLRPDPKVLAGSYYYCRNFYEVDNVSTIEVDILEDVLSENGINEFHFLKIDIQGGENYVFKSINQWQSVTGVHTEAYSAKLYAEGADISTTLTNLYSRGFELFDLTTIAYAPIVEIGGDTISSKHMLNARPLSGYKARAMVHDILLFKSQVESIPTSDVAFTRRLIFTYCVYEYFDFALFAAEKAYEHELISLSEKGEIISAVRALHKASISAIRRVKEGIRAPAYILPKR